MLIRSEPALDTRSPEVRRRLALELASRDLGLSTGELARRARISVALARRELAALVKQGVLTPTGRGRAVRYERHTLQEDTR
jgi:predicted HTH transcriptional regulator